ncbi:hypothetical protein [Aeromonas salmonicida]|uniref:hypothetical protein n=1 Tax=Aeromonas salmonicida TaxID=645 RepID=UPI003D3245C8
MKSKIEANINNYQEVLAIRFAIDELFNQRITIEQAESIINKHIPDFKFDFDHLYEACVEMVKLFVDNGDAGSMVKFVYENRESQKAEFDQLVAGYFSYLKGVLDSGKCASPFSFNKDALCDFILS